MVAPWAACKHRNTASPIAGPELGLAQGALDSVAVLSGSDLLGFAVEGDQPHLNPRAKAGDELGGGLLGGVDPGGGNVGGDHGLGHVQGDQHSPALRVTPLTSRC